jgi:hypothetical protein
MNLTGLSRVLTGFVFFSAVSLIAQVRYVQVTPTIIQHRLDLYKGNDTTREAALVRLFQRLDARLQACLSNGCQAGSNQT